MYDQLIPLITKFLQTHEDLKETAWTIKDTSHHPTQKNGIDCGLFTCAAALCSIARQEMTFNHQHMTHFRAHLAQSLIDDSTPQSHVSSLPKRAPKKAHTRKPSKRTTTTTEQQHPGKQTQHQLTRLTKSRREERKGRGEVTRRVTPGNLRGRCGESVTLIKPPAPSPHCKVWPARNGYRTQVPPQKTEQGPPTPSPRPAEANNHQQSANSRLQEHKSPSCTSGASAEQHKIKGGTT